MLRQTRFIRQLTAEDLVDIELDVIRGRVVGFRMNYRAFLRESWHEVVRYDTSHGRLHVHRFWLDARSRVMDLEDARNPFGDYRRQFKEAIDDITLRWRAYRERTEVNIHDQETDDERQ